MEVSWDLDSVSKDDFDPYPLFPVPMSVDLDDGVSFLRGEVMNFPSECKDQYCEILGACMLYTAVNVAQQLNAGERSISFYSDIDLDKDEFCMSFKSLPVEAIDVE